MSLQTAIPSKTQEAISLEFFDTVPERRASDSAKWNYFGEDILPMWVADMDFYSPPAMLDALHARIDHGTFGYSKDPVHLRELICARMASLYDWQIKPEHMIFLPGLVSGLNLVASASGEPGSGILVNTPVYGPFLSAPTNQSRELHQAPLALTHLQDDAGRNYLHYDLDFDALTAATQPNTRMFTLCNPHNPVGRVYTRTELEQIAEFCLRHNLDICSDEIHSDLLLDGNQHLPIAAISPELAERCITLLAPSKTFNVPGLGCSIAIISNDELRQRVEKAASGIIPHVNLLGKVAATAAYEHGGPWLDTLKEYLTINRNLVFDFFAKNLPEVKQTLPEGTYLSWLDFRAYGLTDPYKFFFDNANVALGSGTSFGEPGEGYVRFNFGTNKATLMQGLNQMAEAVQNAQS